MLHMRALVSEKISNSLTPPNSEYETETNVRLFYLNLSLKFSQVFF